MISREISRAWDFFRAQGFKNTLLSREAPFLIQFGKYGVCGVFSVLVFFVVVLVGELFFSTFFSTDLPKLERAIHLIPLHLIAFIPSNFTAYFLNRWLVFTPGRHQFGKEMLYFTIISFISFFLGELLTFFLVTQASANNLVAHFTFIVGSALVNFVCRKFLVFEK
jgi:putative flippase GtrA